MSWTLTYRKIDEKHLDKNLLLLSDNPLIHRILVICLHEGFQLNVAVAAGGITI